MTTGTEATLAGVALGGQNTYEWPLTTGVVPHEATFEITLDVFAALEQANAFGISLESPGLSYVVKRAGQEVQRVERLFIVDVYPGSNSEFTKRIRVVDRRWLWSKVHVATSYNVRRATGESVVVADGRNPETPDLVPQITWAKPSLLDENVAWTANQVLDDVFTQVSGVPPRLDGDFDGLPVDDLVLDDPGHFALERVLAYFPGAAVYLDYQGNAVVKDSLSRAEREVFERFKDKQQVTKGVDVIDRRYSRPSKVVVLFTPELDMRFDYEEAPTGTQTNLEDSNRLHNVAQVTEPQGLEVNGQNLGPGSWAKMSDLFTAWGTGPGQRPGGGAPRQLSFDILRKHYASDFRHLQLEFTMLNYLPYAPWVRRMAAARAAYRRTFRIDRDFMARLASVRPVRASVISPNTGARASSPVYSDYVMRPGLRGQNPLSGVDSPHGVAERGYSDLINSSSLQPAPVRITTVDPGAGIFQLVPQQSDAQGWYQAIMLGYPDTTEAGSTNRYNAAKGVPVQSLGHPDLSTRLLFGACWDYVTLEADWKFCTVMSCVPASPNNTQRLYKLEITAAQLGEGPAFGPPVYVRVFPGVVSARFAWLDEDAAVTVGRLRGESTAWPTQLVNRSHIDDVAEASAKRVYELYRDRPFGSMQVDAVGDIEPVGLIDRVTQQMQGGATTTRIDFGTVRSPLDIWRYLPGSTRRALLQSQLSLADPLGQSLGFA